MYFFCVIIGYLFACGLCLVNDYFLQQGRGLSFEKKEEEERETVEDLKKKYTRKGEVIEWH